VIWLLIGAFVWAVGSVAGGILVGKSIKRADEMQERDVF
jgi:membrane protein DedA with SNARE-associated domain